LKRKPVFYRSVPLPWLSLSHVQLQHTRRKWWSYTERNIYDFI